MKLTVLGSGAALFNPKAPYRFPASHLIETAGIKILLDAGIGVLPQMTKLGLIITDISVIAISHFHADHCTLQPLLQAYFLEGKFKNNKPTLHILGPSGIEERARIGFDQSGFNYAEDFLPNVDITFTEYQSAQPVTLNEAATLTPYATKHFGLEAYALRVESSGKVITYSGDSAVSDGLQSAAKQADIFLCEASNVVGKPSDLGHVNPHDAAMIAKQAKAMKLVITHYPGYDDKDAIVRDAKKSGFTGPIAVAEDLSSYSVG